MRLLVDEVRRGVAAYGIPPGSGSRTGADGESNVVSFHAPYLLIMGRLG